MACNEPCTGCGRAALILIYQNTSLAAGNLFARALPGLVYCLATSFACSSDMAHKDKPIPGLGNVVSMLPDSAASSSAGVRPKGAKPCLYKYDRGCTHWAYRKCTHCKRPLCKVCLSHFHWPTQSCGRKCQIPDRSRARWARNVLHPRS